jgi:hypothetical protein
VLAFTSNPPGEQQWTGFRFTDDGGWEATFTTRNYKDQTVVFVYRFVVG